MSNTTISTTTTSPTSASTMADVNTAVGTAAALPGPLKLPIDRPFDAFLHEKVTSTGGASAAGHHFIQAYNQDKWGFYLQYVRGLRPKHTKPALVFGGALHDSKEAFYLYNYDIDAMMSTFKAVMNSRSREYEDPSVYAKDIQDGEKMLLYWANTWADEDAKTFDIIEVEGSHDFLLANGFRASVRWDLLVRNRDTHKYYLMDTKSTRYSVDKTYQSVEGQDQVTMYLLGLSRVYPGIMPYVVGLVPDIMYKRQTRVDAARPGVVFRSARELIEYEQELIGLHIELSQKMEALEQGFPYPHMLFPRNGKDNSYFGNEWPDLYRSPLPSDPTKAPVGYVIDQSLIDAGPLNPANRSPSTSFDNTLDVLGGYQ